MEVCIFLFGKCCSFILFPFDIISVFEYNLVMAVNLNEICRLCLEEIKKPSATLKEGSNLLIKIRRFLPLVKVSFIKICNTFFLGCGGVGLSCMHPYVFSSNAIRSNF
jgi:hypothetical protein